MKALSVEQSIMNGEKELQELFKYVETDAQELQAYDMEKEIFSRIMQIGLAAMTCYFAEKGSGEVGWELSLEDGVIKSVRFIFHSSRFIVFLIIFPISVCT